MFFESWESIARMLMTGVVAYVSLIGILRISGKRTLSKMNAFDWVVTVALGSTLATVLLSKDVALADGVLAMALLVLLQYIVAWLSVRSKRIRNLVRSEPSLLHYRGEYLRDTMQQQRVTEAEIVQAARSQGIAQLGAHAVVLETDGSLNVIDVAGVASPSTLIELI